MTAATSSCPADIPVAGVDRLGTGFRRSGMRFYRTLTRRTCFARYTLDILVAWQRS